MAMVAIKDGGLLEEVVRRSKRGEVVKRKEDRRGVSLASDMAWSRVTPYHPLGVFLDEDMLGEAEVRWKEDGPGESTWRAGTNREGGGQEVSARPPFAHRLFGFNRHTGRPDLENLKVTF